MLSVRCYFLISNHLISHLKKIALSVSRMEKQRKIMNFIGLFKKLNSCFRDGGFNFSKTMNNRPRSFLQRCCSILVFALCAINNISNL